MWEPRHLITLWAFTACHRDSFTFFAVYNKTIQILAYADNIVLIGRNTGVLIEAIINLSKAAEETGLIISLQKTKYMEVIKRLSNSRLLKVNDQKFEIVKEVSYLGSIVTKENNIIVEINVIAN
jgi:hypothetical protein